MRTERYLAISLIIAVLAYLPVLFDLQYIGEESVYTIMSYEMNFNKSWMVATMYGEPYWRPPLFNWLIILGSKIIGWNQSLEVARFISIASSTLCSVSVYWFSRKINLKTSTSLGNALIFITCWQISSNYGWLAYSDALLNFFITLGIFNAILAAKTTKSRHLYLAIILAFFALLTKAITGYIHITVAFIIACYFYKKLTFLTKPRVLLAHALFGLLFYAWNQLSPTGEITTQGALSDITQKLNGFLSTSYPIHLGELLLSLSFNFLPWSFLFIWLAIKYKKEIKISYIPNDFLILTVIAISVFLPYWLAPHGHSRYILPVYALLAVLLGTWLWHLNMQRMIILVSSIMIGIKIIYLSFLFPIYVHKYRPDVFAIANEINLITENDHLYANDGGWLGIAVVDTINRQHPEKIVLIYKDSVTNGFVISHTNEPQVGQIVKDYGKMRLLCLGRACSKVTSKIKF